MDRLHASAVENNVVVARGCSGSLLLASITGHLHLRFSQRLLNRKFELLVFIQGVPLLLLLHPRLLNFCFLLLLGRLFGQLRFLCVLNPVYFVQHCFHLRLEFVLGLLNKTFQTAPKLFRLRWSTLLVRLNEHRYFSLLN